MKRKGQEKPLDDHRWQSCQCFTSGATSDEHVPEAV